MIKGGIVDISEIVLRVAESEPAMAALPEDVRKAVTEFNEKNKERILKEKAEKEERERRRREYEEAEKRKEQSEMDKLLCRGEWGEKVPRNRRFALCYKEVPHFIGYVGQEKREDKWVPRGEYCPIDLVRGYMAPYWVYFGGGPDHCWKDRMRALFAAEDELSLFRKIRIDWNFFRLREEDDGFSVCEYSVDEKGHVTILRIGEKKTLKEHQEELKKEFGD